MQDLNQWIHGTFQGWHTKATGLGFGLRARTAAKNGRIPGDLLHARMSGTHTSCISRRAMEGFTAGARMLQQIKELG